MKLNDLAQTTPWTLARRAERMNPSVIREILKVTEKPGIISFAGGLPSPKTFPVGEFAAQGNCDARLLQRLLDEPWFALAPPKSTGREVFHLDWVQSRLQGGEAAADVQATLLELTAASVAGALRAQQPQTRRVLVCGGGVHNPRLLRRIAAHLPDAVVESTAAQGLDPDFVEAMGFAWLARETLAGRPGNLPSVSGAKGPRVLGVVYPA